MTRAHLADPHLIRKSRTGRARESTRCVGANVCVGRALAGVEVACVLNPATGREALLGEGTLVPAAEPRSIVVVGAGPAGLRVAATAAARGHRVVVYERAGEPGGHLRGLAWLPTRGSWNRAVDDLSPRSSAATDCCGWRARPGRPRSQRSGRTSSCWRPAPAGTRAASAPAVRTGTASPVPPTGARSRSTSRSRGPATTRARWARAW